MLSNGSGLLPENLMEVSSLTNTSLKIINILYKCMIEDIPLKTFKNFWNSIFGLKLILKFYSLSPLMLSGKVLQEFRRFTIGNHKIAMGI